jgi:cAMP-dependent protein kinase regulator
MEVEYPQGFTWNRRQAVSSESPDITEMGSHVFPVHPKTEQVRQQLEAVLTKIVMFKHLRGSPRNTVIDAMKACEFPTGHIVIQEGAVDGEDMYIIIDGQLDVFYGQSKVATIGPGRFFGEVALMYNCPRTATIVAITPVILYSISRPVFRSILIDESIQQRRRYEDFLKNVPLLKSLLPYEVSRFADALEPEEHQDGDLIMTEGQVEVNPKFYIVEKGQLLCTKRDALTGNEIQSVTLGEGGYCGEIALLANKPRQATVRCVGPTSLLGIARDHFLMVVGPVNEILKRNMENYKTVEQLLGEKMDIVS